MGRDGAQDAVRHQAHELGSRHLGPFRHRVVDSIGAHDEWLDEVARNLDLAADGDAQGAHGLTAQHPRDRPCGRQVRDGEPQVVRHEETACAHGDRPCHRMGEPGAGIGGDGRERLAAQLRQGPFRGGPVEEAGYAELVGSPSGETAPRRPGRRHRFVATEGNERNDVDDSESGMGAGVATQVDSLRCDPRELPRRGLCVGTGEGEHGAVMVGIRVHVEKVCAGGVADRAEHVRAPALAHVDDALEHGPNVAHVDLGLALPQYDFAFGGRAPLSWTTVVEWAVDAEAAGFASVWLADHLYLSTERYGGGAGDYFGLDPIVALAALARVTTTVRLGTLVLCTPFRPATVLAKILASLDVMSAGRLTVGLGTGWFDEEFNSARIPFGTPGERLAGLTAAVATLRSVWSGAADAPPCRPAPLQRPGPPVVLGGRGDRLLALVARAADGWNAQGWADDPEKSSFDAGSTELDRACEAVGRDPATVLRSVNRFTLVGENEPDLARRFARIPACTPGGVLDGHTLASWRKGRLVGTVDQVRQQLADWQGRGVSTFVMGLGALPFGGTDGDDLRMLASLTS